MLRSSRGARGVPSLLFQQRQTDKLTKRRKLFFQKQPLFTINGIRESNTCSNRSLTSLRLRKLRQTDQWTDQPSDGIYQIYKLLHIRKFKNAVALHTVLQLLITTPPKF